jgi:hypothetical protein
VNGHGEVDAQTTQDDDGVPRPEAGVAAQDQLAGRSRSTQARDELFDEALDSRCVWACPLRIRAWSTSPVSARVTRMG